MAANATFALKAGVWVRRVRLLIVSPDSTGTTCRCQAETPPIILSKFPAPALPAELGRARVGCDLPTAELALRVPQQQQPAVRGLVAATKIHCSEGITYKLPCGEVAMCPRVGRMEPIKG
jgi:hypothetical protein